MEQEAKRVDGEVDAKRLAITTSDALLHVLAALESLDRIEAERRLG